MNIHSIADAAKPYTDYDMIRDHTELPDFPNFRSQLLFAFLHRNSRVPEQSELYTVVVSLAQMGLDTHDLVSETNVVKEKKEARSRQMRVLAGDYFSSRFYQLLAQAGQVELTSQLASAICEVNRMKMNLYTRMRQWTMTADEYIHSMVGIKSQLYMCFEKLVDGLGPASWADMLLGYTRCEVILDELRRLEAGGDLHSGWAYWHLLQIGTKEELRELQAGEIDPRKLHSLARKYKIQAQLTEMLDTQVKLLMGKIRQINSEKLVKELFAIGEPFLRALHGPKILEEV